MPCAAPAPRHPPPALTGLSLRRGPASGPASTGTRKDHYSQEMPSKQVTQVTPWVLVEAWSTRTPLKKAFLHIKVNIQPWYRKQKHLLPVSHYNSYFFLPGKSGIYYPKAIKMEFLAHFLTQTSLPATVRWPLWKPQKEQETGFTSQEPAG